ncbi:MAG: hypothetical protein EB082_07550, partial [Verrucomicrobia bacterium]|nr:hypothetical protein [Verrucomicrobiota bacterium]
MQRQHLPGRCQRLPQDRIRVHAGERLIHQGKRKHSTGRPENLGVDVGGRVVQRGGDAAVVNPLQPGPPQKPQAARIGEHPDPTVSPCLQRAHEPCHGLKILEADVLVLARRTSFWLRPEAVQVNHADGLPVGAKEPSFHRKSKMFTSAVMPLSIKASRRVQRSMIRASLRAA